MKKLLVPFVCLLLAFGCAKKSTPTKSMPSSNNSAPIIDNSGANNNSTTGSNTSVATIDSGGYTRTPVNPATGNDALAAEGARIYNQKCNKCHGLKVVADYTWERWASIMQVMAMKANLNEIEKQKVLVYVHVNAKKG